MNHLSNIIYRKAKELRYEDFVTWFDNRVDIETLKKSPKFLYESKDLKISNPSDDPDVIVFEDVFGNEKTIDIVDFEKLISVLFCVNDY